MVRTDTLVDAGPLVSYFHRRDEHHEWATRQMAHLSPPLYTCEAVLSKAFHLLEEAPQGAQTLVAFLERGIVEVPFAYAEHTGRVHERMRTYADQPMSLADACLVRMAETHPERPVVTADDDFQVYRTASDESLDMRLPNG